MGEIRLCVKKRAHGEGCYIASVPLKRLLKLAEYKQKVWKVRVLDGAVWLILEGF